MNIFTYILKPICYSILLSLSLSVYSQNSESNCGNVTSTESIEYVNSIKSQLKIYEQQFLDLSSNYNKSGVKVINSIPIKAHVIRSSNGSGGISTIELNAAINNLNAIYAEAYMEFVLCDDVNYIDNDKYYHFKKDAANTLTETNNVPGLINIYFTNYIENDSNLSICGYSDNAFGNDYIIMKNDCATNNSTLVHEMGHFFSLMHTHGPDNNTLTTELVDGSNCDTDGDGICDTPADPKLSSQNVNNFCEYIGTETDANGQVYTPDTGNIMSYAKKTCRTHFSKQQLARMYAFYLTTKNYFSCPSFNANFVADKSQTCDENLTVNFESSCANITKWEWDINSDGIIDYTTKNPTHTYSSGVYDVTLKVSNKSKTISKTYSKFIKVGTQTTLLDENFDSFEVAGDKGWTTNDASRSGYNWYSNFSKTSSKGTGPSRDHTTGEVLGQYIYAEASNANPGDVAEFISPCINVEYSNSELEFAYHMFGKHVGELHIDIKTDNGYINDVIPPLYGSQQMNQDDDFLIKTVDLSSYANQTIKIRFRAVRGASWDGDIAIDDVYIKTIHTSITDSSFKAYPNPVKNNMLYIKSNTSEQDSEGIINYEISNLFGQKFLVGTVSRQPINTSALPSGTYLLTIYDDTSKIVKKIIK